MPRVIAENELCIVLDKPVGLISHRDGRTLEPSVSEWLWDQYPTMRGVGGFWVSPQGENIALNGLVHRLDRNTSGVLLAAKTQEAFEYLKNQFKEKRVEKNYLALVSGQMPEDSGIVVAEIMRSSDKPKRWYARACDINDPRAAVTQWRVLKEATGVSLIKVTPKTGRTHQIRVHLSFIGHPLVGDVLYGGDATVMNTPALHAASITFSLPDGARVTYESTPPGYFSM